jgi:tetratricopeptide (TPR) repeat protein
MELLYNPESMPEQEIKDTFVGREWLIAEIVNLIGRQPVGPGLQHVVIIGPRGMGKTTMLLMLRFAIKDRGLISDWQPVKFREESYGINDLADFWMEALSLLAADTEDTALAKSLEQLKAGNRGDGGLAETALATIKDWCRISKKRLLLLVDNIDMILEQINDDLDFARLRDVLMNDGSVMIVGTSVSFFKEARAYDQPLYNFFKTYDLAGLKLDQTQNLLRKRANLDGLKDFSSKLEEHKGRLKALDFFTGGNPRFVLMLYRVLALSDVSEVRSALEKLLDEITPFYKAKVESLPAQQRKILDQIARTSGRTNEGLTPAQIAADTRLRANQVSAQLKRLNDLGYVRAANIRGRSSYYALSEPLYALWHQMRFGRDAYERMKWLVDFLKIWLGPEEMALETMRLENVFHRHLASGMLRQACDVLEHRRYLSEAMGEPHGLSAADANGKLGDEANRAGNYSEALEHYERAIVSKPDGYRGWLACGWTLNSLERFTEALTAFDRALQLAPEELRGGPLLGRAVARMDLEMYSEALLDFDGALAKEPRLAGAWALKAIALSGMERHEEALENYDSAIRLDPNCEAFHASRGVSLIELGRHDEAISGYMAFLRGRRGSKLVLEGLMHALSAAGRMEEGPAMFTDLLKVAPGDSSIRFRRGVCLHRLGKAQRSLADFNSAVKADPSYDLAWLYRGCALGELRRFGSAISSFERAIEINADLTEAREFMVDALLARFVQSALTLGAKAPTEDWEGALRAVRDLPRDQPYGRVSSAPLSIARAGHWRFARDLIGEADLYDRLFPLARALDYLVTGDQSLLEKLSPEVRGIVDQVVRDLRSRPGSRKASSRKAKAEPATQKRTRGKTTRRPRSSITARRKQLS